MTGKLRFLAALLSGGVIFLTGRADEFEARSQEIASAKGKVPEYAKADVRLFHDEVLRNGAAPLGVLDAHILRCLPARRTFPPPMQIGVPKEIKIGETRVSIVARAGA